VGNPPLIIPVTDFRQDVAGAIRLATASGEPVYLTQRGRATAVLLSRLSYERLRREHQILRMAAVGDLGVPLGAGLTLEEILARGERALAEEQRVTAAERVADTRALEAEEREAMRPPRQLTTDDFISSEGFGHLVASPAADGAGADANAAGFYGPSAWYSTVTDE
jgi:prevent-host-death family protein